MSQQELNSIIEIMRNFSWGTTPTEMRASFNDSANLLPPHPTAIIEEVDANGIPASLISTPQAAKDRVILYLHGGGFIAGSRISHRRLASDFSEATDATVLLIDYRLVPEHPYPAALEDTITAYEWLMNERDFSPSHIAIAGDSAGGNLALTTLLSLRNAGKPLPVAALLISPLTDMERTGQTHKTKADIDLMVLPQILEAGINMYLPTANFRDPMVSPIYANLSGLPPMLIHVGNQEVLLDDSLRLARKAALDDVSVELKVWKGMIHSLHLFAPMLTEGREAIVEAGAFLRNHLLQNNQPKDFN
ncbi:alpha/beta hydrolase [Mastigocladus laminosus UU774]|nr:alpha/beta hydrolase [Mastigocladus laminosus UU774]